MTFYNSRKQTKNRDFLKTYLTKIDSKKTITKIHDRINLKEILTIEAFMYTFI